MRLADTVMMVTMMMETTTTIDANFLPVDMVVIITEAGTVMETTMTTTDANSRVLKWPLDRKSVV